MIVSFDAASGRVGVKIDDAEKVMALKPVNLSVITSDKRALRRAATREAYEQHHQKVLEEGGDASVTAFAICALSHAAAMARSAGAPEPPVDPSHPGPGGPTPRRVLEIGCGLGAAAANFTMLCRAPADIVGLDISASCIEHAKTAWESGRPDSRLSFYTADAADVAAGTLDVPLRLVPASAGSLFDLVYSNASLLHLPPRDLSHLLRSLLVRVDFDRGLLAANFITYSLSSLQPRKGGGFARFRGLQTLCIDDPLEAACEASVRLGFPLTLSNATGRKFVEQLIDEHSLEDDGGGLGLEIRTGSEFIPGAYERHYSRDALRALVEDAGWDVRECRHNTAEESHAGAGAYIYLLAQPHKAS